MLFWCEWQVVEEWLEACLRLQFLFVLWRRTRDGVTSQLSE